MMETQVFNSNTEFYNKINNYTCGACSFSHHFSRWRDAEEGIFFNGNARLFFVVAVFADNAIERIAVCSTRNVDIIDEALFQHDSVRYRRSVVSAPTRTT